MLQRLRGRACSAVGVLTLCSGLVLAAGAGTAAAQCRNCAAGVLSAGIRTNVLNGVAAVSRSAAWAVGYSYNGSENKALIERWNGRRWQIWRSPNPGYTGSTLHGVASVSRASAWAVGTVSRRVGGGTLIEHWNGRRWRVQASQNPVPGPDQLTGVAALSNSNAWAVGASSLGEHTLIEHWNGRRWRVQPSPSPTSNENVLTAVAAFSPGDVWAVGYTIDQNAVWRTLIEHWNGHRWRVQASQSPGTLANLLEGVAATGRSRVWAVGSSTNTAGVQSALILRWDGRRWKMQPSPTSAFGIALQSAARVSGSRVWAAGFTGSRTVAEYWNGRKWQIKNTPDPIFSADPRLALNGVAALSGSNVWAVGYSGEEFNPDSRTLIEHWNGRKWKVVRSPNPL